MTLIKAIKNESHLNKTSMSFIYMQPRMTVHLPLVRSHKGNITIGFYNYGL